MCKRTYRISNAVGLTAPVRGAATAAVSLTASLLVFFATASGYAAAPQPQEPKTPAPHVAVSPAAPNDAVETARQALGKVQTRYIAGIASNTEMEDARYALVLAVASARLTDARTAGEQQKAQVAAGIAPVNTLAVSELTVTEREVALLQVQTDHLQQVVARLQVQVTVGILSRTEGDAAIKKRDAAQAQLATVKARYATQKIAVLKTRLEELQARQRAGIISPSEVDQARADYEDALAAFAKAK